MKQEVIELLQSHGVQPSAQRVAVAEYVLFTEEHPSAEQVFTRVSAGFPLISRATIYNTLNLFVEKGLLRALFIAEGRVVYDPKLERHHHFINVETGAIEDIPWSQVRVSNVNNLEHLEIEDYQVVLRGRVKRPAKLAKRNRVRPNS